MMRVKHIGSAPQLPNELRNPDYDVDDDFDGEDSLRFDDWKHTFLAYGLVVIGACIVIYGVVGQ